MQGDKERMRAGERLTWEVPDKAVECIIPTEKEKRANTELCIDIWHGLILFSL